MKYEKNEVTGKSEGTGEIDGYNCEVLMRDKKYKSIRIAILSDRPIITQQEIDKTEQIKVAFEGLTINPYVSNGFITLSFQAEQIKLIK